MIERTNIIAELEKELDDTLSDELESLSESARKEIKDETVDEAKRVLDSLSSRELQSASAFERFIKTTLAHARMRIHMR